VELEKQELERWKCDNELIYFDGFLTHFAYPPSSDEKFESTTESLIFVMLPENRFVNRNSERI